MRYLTNKWVLRAIGPVLFCIILFRIDLPQLAELLSKINPLYIILAVILFVPLIIVKAWRWQLLMNAQGIGYSLLDSSVMYAAAMYIGVITPGRLGDFVKVFYLVKDDHPFGRSFATVLLDRLFDLVSLLLIAYASMLAFITIFESTVIIMSVIIAVTFVLVVFFLIKKELSTRVLKRIAFGFIPLKHREKAGQVFSDFGNAVNKSGSRQLFQTISITILAWIIYYLTVYFLASAIGIDIPFLYLVTCVSITAVITLIPISISGIGTRDTVMILLFSQLGLSEESAIAFSIMILFMYAVNGVIGLLAWVKKPVRML